MAFPNITHQKKHHVLEKSYPFLVYNSQPYSSKYLFDTLFIIYLIQTLYQKLFTAVKSFIKNCLLKVVQNYFYFALTNLL